MPAEYAAPLVGDASGFVRRFRLKGVGASPFHAQERKMLGIPFLASIRRSAKTKLESSRLKYRKNQHALRCESLERREMHAVLADESLVNVFSTARNQHSAATASAPDGRSVVVWQHSYSSSDWDIYAQRYDRSGARIGGEIRVATSTRNEFAPDVSMDNSGNFVVAWHIEATRGNNDIQAKRYNSIGVPQGSTISVATSARSEYNPKIASDANGNFVVAWTKDFSPTDKDVMARMFRSNGSAVSSEFSVASSGQFNETRPDVARAPNGQFWIVYETNAGNGDIMLKRFNSSGSAIATDSIATGVNRQIDPQISMDSSSGSAVVAWQEFITRGNVELRARYIGISGTQAASQLVLRRDAFSAGINVAARRNGASTYVVTSLDFRGGLDVIEMRLFGGVGNRTFINIGVNDSVAVTFGDGNNYSLCFSRNAVNQGTNIYRRRGTLSGSRT
jgi:hypothetical protein